MTDSPYITEVVHIKICQENYIDNA
jgi:hypothetical protein